MKFYAAHEVLHTGNLVPPPALTILRDRELPRQRPHSKVDSKTSGFNTFYIPTLPDSVTSLYKSDYLLE